MNDIPDNKRTRYQFYADLGNHLTFASYFGSYERAFEALMEKVYQSGNHIDLLAFPILFIARHCMELGFKTNIRYFLKYSEKDDFKKAGIHDLEKLFGAFKLHIAETVKNLYSKHGIEVEKSDISEFNKYCEEVNKLTNIFHLLDKNSDSFRYPVDKENNKSFDQKDKINLLDVRDLYKKTTILLTHTADIFAKYTDYADEIEDMYEREMRDYYGC